MEICEKVRQALKIIEKLNGSLPDDTYLEKTIDGLAKILQDTNTNQDFLQKSGIEEFIEQHFNSESLQFLAFRLAKISFHVKSDVIYEKLRALKKWPSSSDFMELLSTLLQFKSNQNEDFLQLIWTNILARIILSMNEKSLFWKNSAKNLIFRFLCSVQSSMQQTLISRISTVLTDKISTNQVCSEALILYLKQSDVDYISFVPEEKLSLEATVYKRLKCNEDVESYLLSVFDENNAKAWIKAAKIVPDYLSIQAKLLLLAQQDHKHISSLISTNSSQLSLSLWNLILEHYLHDFVNDEAMLSLANPTDLKLFTSCLGSAKLLVPKIPSSIPETQWSILIQMTKIPELDGITRSLVIDLITVVITEEKKKISLENLASQLWHLTLKKDWETIDALLFCLSCKHLGSEMTSPLPKSLLGFALVHLNHDSSFVRKAALQFLEKLWEMDSNILLSSPESMEPKLRHILQNDTEAIVRRQATIFITRLQWYEMGLEATKDLDWEVKSIAFQFWTSQSEEMMKNSSDFPTLLNELETKNILQGLKLTCQDYEKSLQNDCFSWLKMFKEEIFAKFPMITREDVQSNEFLQIVLFDMDLDAKMRDYIGFCEHHYGLSSVLDDIIQLEANQSTIDTIDCF